MPQVGSFLPIPLSLRETYVSLWSWDPFLIFFKKKVGWGIFLCTSSPALKGQRVHLTLPPSSRPWDSPSALWNCWCLRRRQPFWSVCRDIWLRRGFPIDMERPACKMNRPAARALPSRNMHPDITAPCHVVLGVLGPQKHELIHSLVHSFHSSVRTFLCPPTIRAPMKIFDFHVPL